MQHNISAKQEGLIFIEPLPVWTIKEILESNPPEPDWIVKGILAKGSITELDAKVKYGKTTFALAMIKAIVERKEFLGMPTQKVKILYLYEARPATLTDEIYRLGLQNTEDVVFVYKGAVRGKPWTYIDAMVREYIREHGIGMIVVDTLSKWSGVKEENSTSEGVESIDPLEVWADEGVAIWANRQSRKGGGELSDVARGAGAVTGVSDIVLSMTRTSHRNRRRITGEGRFSGIPEEMYFEVDKSTGEYKFLGYNKDVQQRKYQQLVKENLGACRTVKEFEDKFNAANDEKFSRTSFDRVMDSFVAEGVVEKMPNAFGKEVGFFPKGGVPLGRS